MIRRPAPCPRSLLGRDRRVPTTRATVVGQSIQDLLFRTIFTSRNAELQSRACMMGAVEPLNAVEAQKCYVFYQGPRPTERAWEYWSMRLQNTEALHAMAMRALAAQ